MSPCKISQLQNKTPPVLFGLLIFGLFIYFIFHFDKTSHEETGTNSEDTNTGIYADISNNSVKTFEDCQQTEGSKPNKKSPAECHHDGIVYYRVPREGLENLNPQKI
jgi:hypothetical protein